MKRTALAVLAAFPVMLGAQQKLPEKLAAKPTSAEINARDLMSRLYVFADDSMQGRETGTVGHVKSTEYIANELKRLGLTPAGDNGTFFQDLPMVNRSIDPASTFGVEGKAFRALTDYLATPPARAGSRPLKEAQAIYGGVLGDTARMITPELARGKLVIFAGGGAAVGGPGGAGGRGGALLAPIQGVAAGVVLVVGDALPPALIRAAAPRPGNVTMQASPSGPQAAMTITATRGVAELLLGGPLAGAPTGQLGKLVTGDIRFIETPAPARNVVATLAGTDQTLRGQYVAIGAHSDHVGFGTTAPVDHDSLHLYNQARFAVVGMVARGQQPTAEQRARVDAIRINLDSMRAKRPVRRDSIRNGADDDGSGSVTLLEVAEAFAKGKRPKRSIVFVWHTGEEKGLLGSRWYADHPTVPRDSIVAQLNMDMVGRGEASDLPVGSPDYLALVGSRRLSTELGDLVESENKKLKRPFAFDYQFDANGHPENIYCRSDHYNYARWGIPVVFATTGLHGDYHQVTDEPQYIDYGHMARIGQFMQRLALTVGNLDHRPVVDKAKPDPNGACRQ